MSEGAPWPPARARRRWSSGAGVRVQSMVLGGLAFEEGHAENDEPRAQEREGGAPREPGLFGDDLLEERVARARGGAGMRLARARWLRWFRNL